MEKHFTSIFNSLFIKKRTSPLTPLTVSALCVCVCSVRWPVWCHYINGLSRELVIKWGYESGRLFLYAWKGEVWGSQLLRVITHAQWEDTQMHTGTQSHIQMSKICMWGVTWHSSGEMCLFVCSPFFHTIHTNAGRALTCPLSEFLFMDMYPLSSQIDPSIYELGLTCILLLSLQLLCMGNNIRRWRCGGRVFTAAIVRLVWFMIYADRIAPEVTPLEELGCKNLFYPID